LHPKTSYLIFFLALASILILRSYKTEYFTSPVFSIHKRIIYWQQTLSVILKHPFRGVGLGNLPFIQSQFAHNSYLQIWAEIGLLGIVGFFLPEVCIFWWIIAALFLSYAHAAQET